ncbi:metalloprotease [Mangrovimonas spongiae]|uniref:Metalloprotease n=2 Tax=Mangrovimonas spongiae TaxID=2494697 RepID=A0A428K1H1_9FLAO|nr:metalloprotease [Mangrovimonas spongiae]
MFRLRFLSSLPYLLLILSLFLSSMPLLCQNKIDIKADFNVTNKSIKISQNITYYNTSNKVLDTIYLNDWSHSYSTKKTPLANRFAEEYKTEFHFAKNEDRGYSVVTSITQNGEDVFFDRLKNHIDVIKVALQTPLQPSQSYTIKINYIVQVPNDKFTRYGFTSDGNFNLRYWYITPAVFNGEWQYYSNKDLDDLFAPEANIILQATYPKIYTLTSELDELTSTENDSTITTVLTGEKRINSRLFLQKQNNFSTTGTDNFLLVSNIDDEELHIVDKALVIDNVSKFLKENLIEYPHKKLLLTHIDYKKNPIYGLNLLPDFIRPFPDKFQYELKILKTALHNYLENTLIINPREDQWIIDGLQTYFLMKYVDEYYPNMKIFGTLSKIWGIRSFHAAQLDFNDQYNFLYMHMARENLDQPLLMEKDSLLKFNENIANKYKAGIGLRYLDDFVNANTVEKTIKQYLSDYALKQTNSKDFENLLKSNTTKDINWFFTDYLKTNKQIDFKITQLESTKDSIKVTIKNKRNNNMPVSLFGINNDTVISKYWVEHIHGEKTITIPNNNIEKLVLNYDKSIPEFNLRDNWKSTKGFLLNNRPLQFRLFTDIEDPYYNQVFFMPQFDYNLYDGVSPGIKLANKTVLEKPFHYDIRPTYGLRSKQLRGKAKFSYKHNLKNNNLYYVRYGLTGEYSNYAPELSYSEFTPYLQFRFRDHKNLRDNKKKYLTLRYVNINREEDPTGEFNVEDEPSYSVFNMNYGQSDPNLKNYNSWNADLQLAKKFGKLSFTYEYRKLTEKNRQYNLRLFTGLFLYNNSYQTSNYFSFALDRPTDYLFDYNYYGRSEESGLFSQQLIIAEGGFKSKLNTPYANQWISTINGSTTIWRYIHAYGDAGLVKSHYNDAKFVYDSGIRFSLVDDYFELYFPIYSNLGWEIAQPNYDQKIRFIIALDLQTLFGLFSRRWY